MELEENFHELHVCASAAKSVVADHINDGVAEKAHENVSVQKVSHGRRNVISRLFLLKQHH